MTTKTDITLLPCPMCGKTDLDHNDYLHTDGVMRVRCAWCHCEAPESAWNRRAAIEADRQDHLRGATKMVPSDSFSACAIGDSNYAAGMLLGWNLCIEGNEEKFSQTREARLRAAAQASRAAKSQESAPVAQEPVAEVLSSRLGNDTSTIDKALPAGTKLYAQAQPTIRESLKAAQDHDAGLADTQRAIIEAAERRGYARAEAENVGYRTDAGRYRFIRTGDAAVWCSSGDDLLTGDRLDAAIDAARAAEWADHG